MEQHGKEFPDRTVNPVRIIANALVLTCDRFNTCGRYHIAIRDGIIAGLAKRIDDLLDLFPGSTSIEAEGKLIVPGFVNAHLHGDSILHRIRTEGRHMHSWSSDNALQEANHRLLEPGSHHDLRVLYRYISTVLVQNGITTVCEFTPPVDEEGFGILLQSMGAAGVNVVTTLPNWESVSALRTMGGLRPHGLVSIGKESEYNVYSFRSLTGLAQEERLPLVAHVAETRDDVEIVKKNFHKSPLTVLADYGALRENTLLIHANYLTDQDMEVLRSTPVPLVVCPRSTAYKQTGYPSLRRLLASDLCLALGTDWGNCDIVSELRFVADLPYVIAGMPMRSPAALVRMATVNAASALGLSAEVGSIEAGKKADLTFFTLGEGSVLTSVHDGDPDYLAGLIIHHQSAVHITDVMIDGEFSLEDSRLRTVELDEVVHDMAVLADRYYPGMQSVEAPLQRERPPARILPLIQDEESTSAEGYEEGFSVIGPAHAHHRPAASGKEEPSAPPGTQKETREKITRQPELSKNVRRVFGDDDEV